MCLLVVGIQASLRYPFVAALNRDEFYSRKTAPAHFWNEGLELLAGRDLEKGGTFAGLAKSGRVAFVTNFRRRPLKELDKKSRGELVSGFLKSKGTGVDFLKPVREEVTNYGCFNLVVGTTESLSYYSSESPQAIKVLGPGVHGVSNGKLSAPWPKVRRAVAGFEKAILSEKATESLLEVLSDRTIAPDPELPDTGVGLAMERLLSPVRVQFEGYGTRSSTVILVDKHGWVDFTEVTYITADFSIRRQFRFKL